jgi:hypothetical protein
MDVLFPIIVILLMPLPVVLGCLGMMLPIAWPSWARHAVFMGVLLVYWVGAMLFLSLDVLPLCDTPPPRTRAAQARFEETRHRYMQGIATLHRATRSSAPDP